MSNRISTKNTLAQNYAIANADRVVTPDELERLVLTNRLRSGSNEAEKKAIDALFTAGDREERAALRSMHDDSGKLTCKPTALELQPPRCQAAHAKYSAADRKQGTARLMREYWEAWVYGEAGMGPR